MKFMTLLFLLFITSSAFAHPVDNKETDAKAGNKYWTGKEWVGQAEYDKAAEAFRRFDLGPASLGAGDLSDEINYPPDPSKWMPSEQNKE